LGYSPDQFQRLQPVEVLALWDAWLWRRSREIEVIAVATMWTAGAFSKLNPQKVLDSFPGYKRDDG
jgi:hypothetical protein